MAWVLMIVLYQKKMQNQKMLKNALKSNAGFSILSGLALIVFNATFQSLFQTQLQLWIVGLILLLFAGQVLNLALKSTLPQKEVKAIIVMDILWVVGSAILLLSVPQMPTAGRWIIALVALFVADFAVFQYLGMRKALR